MEVSLFVSTIYVLFLFPSIHSMEVVQIPITTCCKEANVSNIYKVLFIHCPAQ